MGFSGSRGGAGAGEGWGTGLLLVFFPEECSINASKKKRKGSFSMPSSSLSSPHLPKSSSACGVLRFAKPELLLSRTRYTISICFLLIFVTILVFTLCTFEPTVSSPRPRRASPRRWLSENSAGRGRGSWIRSILVRKSRGETAPDVTEVSALQGMGKLFRRGTKAMNDLVVCHVPENVTEGALGLFLRLLHRSGVTSRSDVVLIFAASSSSFDSVIQKENESFLRLVRRHRESSGGGAARAGKAAWFDLAQFVKSGNRSEKEPLWGKKRLQSRGNSNEGGSAQDLRAGAGPRRLVYGSVLGFAAAELDPENALAGFMDPVPMRLRRWACYAMLLGRVRRSFKHVLLVDVGSSVVVRDPFGRVRGRRPESVYLWTMGRGGRRNPDRRRPAMTSSVVMGGARGIRRLAGFVLVEIVRSVARRGGKNVVPAESALFSPLVRNGFLRRSVDLVISPEPIPDASSPAKLGSRSWFSPAFRDGVVLRSDRSRDFDHAVWKEICSYEPDWHVYESCFLLRGE